MRQSNLTPLTLLPMTGVSAPAVQALEASLRSLRSLGDLFSPRRRIEGAVQVIGPGGARPFRTAAGHGVHRNPGSHRCTCPRPARRKTDQPHRTDH